MIFAKRMKRKKSKPAEWSNMGRRIVSGSMLAAVLAVGGAWVPPATAASVLSKAKPTKAPKLLTVEGTVCDKSGAPVKGAVVYLQDPKTMAVRSFLSDRDGQFHFRQLPLNTDFGLWAELNGKRSQTKNISQFNSKPDLHYTLKLNTGK